MVAFSLDEGVDDVSTVPSLVKGGGTTDVSSNDQALVKTPNGQALP